MMFTYRLLNLDGTPAEHPTFTSSQPDWRVGDKVLIRPGTEYRIIGMEAAPPGGPFASARKHTGHAQRLLGYQRYGGICTRGEARGS